MAGLLHAWHSVTCREVRTAAVLFLITKCSRLPLVCSLPARTASQHGWCGGASRAAPLSPLQVADPYSVLIREKKLPLSLLEDPEKKGAGEVGQAETQRGGGHSLSA